MNYKDIHNMTAVQTANAIESAAVAQQVVNDLLTEAFAGSVKLAEQGSRAVQAVKVLAERNSKQLAANKAHCKKHKLNAKQAKQYKADNRYQGLAAFSMMAARWIAKQERFAGLRVSIKTTGEHPTIALAKRDTGNHKPQAKANKAKAEKAKAAKGGKEQALKAFANLNEILKAAADAYGVEAVKAAAAKLS